MNKDFISIIIPVFNGSNFIDAAYNSILNQNLTDFEIIFIDNNSIDDSLEILNGLAKQDSRLTVYKEKKQGAAVARNKGIRFARGEFIFFYDVDDQLYEGGLNRLKNVLVSYPNIDSVFGRSTKSSERKKKSKLIQQVEQHKLKVHYKKELGLKWFKDKSALPGTPSFLHRASVFKSINGFPENLLIGEDAFFHIQLANERIIASFDYKIMHYFRHQKSSVSIQNKKVKEKVFTYWDQTVNAYLPYANSNKCSAKFKEIVLKQTYGSIGKQLVLTKEYTARKILLSKLKKDIAPLKNPILFNFYFNLLVLFPNMFLYKFFVFIVLKYYFTQHKTSRI